MLEQKQEKEEFYMQKLKKLEAEQRKLAKQLKLKDAIDFSVVQTIAGCDSAFVGKQIISAIVVLDTDMQILEQKFFVSKIKFPYIPGFLSYRELPSMLQCYEKIEKKPDILIVDGNGILHPRKFGLASHFGLAIQKPTIGITKNLLLGEVKNGKVYVKNKILAEELFTKKASKPIYVSPGNLITLNSAVKTVKKCIIGYHKLPEPLVAAHRYANSIKKEFERKSS